MPTYEYACKDCDEHLEVKQAFTDEPLTECPTCGGPLRKVFGKIGIAFKGSGFYKTDSRPAKAKASSSASSTASESPSSSSSSSSDGKSSSSSSDGKSESKSTSDSVSSTSSSNGDSKSSDKKSPAAAAS